MCFEFFLHFALHDSAVPVIGFLVGSRGHMMYAEDLQTLCEEGKGARGRAIARGALKLLRSRSGPEMFGAVLAGCLLAAGVLLLLLLPIVLTMAPRSDYVCRRHRISFNGNEAKPTNVYFVKHENRIWTPDDLCHIETAARRFPEYNIFMINLLNNNTSSDVDSNKIERKHLDELLDHFIFQKLKNTILLSQSDNAESRYDIGAVPNIIKVDVSVARFFAGSAMKKRVKNLSSDKIETAAKFELIWEAPGIALEPRLVHQLEKLKRSISGAKKDITAVVQVDDDLQATRVPCQSFIGFVIDYMIRSDYADRRSVLELALSDFCPNFVECEGVKILKPMSRKHPNYATCPTVCLMNSDALNCNTDLMMLQ